MKLKWGIVGLGKIAHSFAKDMIHVEDCGIVAVASRSLNKAEIFSKQYNIIRSYGSYKRLFEDDTVDIIYIATPHNSHMELAIQAMGNGKHVLCEKPIGIHSSQVKKMINSAKQNKVFLMEAMWTRFNPVIKTVLGHIKKGEIGEVKYINADFCFNSDLDSESRLLNMALAGGALLDIGIYPLFLSYLILGKPNKIYASSILHKTGADIQTSVVLKYRNGLSNISCGFNSDSDMIAKIYGSKGNIYIDKRWHESQGYKIKKDEQITAYNIAKKGKGYTYEIEECKACIEAGKLESDLWSHQDSINLMNIMDDIRKQVGVRYPGE